MTVVGTILTLALIAGLFYLAHEKGADSSKALWIPLLWLLIVAGAAELAGRGWRGHAHHVHNGSLWSFVPGGGGDAARRNRAIAPDSQARWRAARPGAAHRD